MTARTACYLKQLGSSVSATCRYTRTKPIDDPRLFGRNCEAFAVIYLSAAAVVTTEHLTSACASIDLNNLLATILIDGVPPGT